MAALSGETVAQILYQAGFRGQDLINMVAISKRESGWDPNAHRTDSNPSALSGDMGLFQINSSNWPAVSQALGLTSKTQLFDPVVNAKAAKWLLDQYGYFPWGMGSNGWSAGGDPFKGTDRAEAGRIVQSANSTGLLGTSYAGGGVQMSNAPTTQSGPVKLPSDAKVVQVQGFGIFAVFEIAPGVVIYYDIPWQDGSVQYDPAKMVTMSGDQWNQTYPKAVGAGSAMELGPVSTTFGTFRGYWDRIVGEVMGFNNPAKDDPGVMLVLAEYAARPDMSDAELQNRLQATTWYQNHTQGQLEWNSLSEAERKARLDDTAARMAATVFQFQGVDIDPDDPRIANYVEQVASGALTFGAYTEIIKDGAKDIDESPWNRQLRDEEEAKRQRPIDIENTAQNIRETAERWGVNWSAATITQWARDIVEKKKSDQDLIETFRDQAQVLFPWKPRELETATAAAPWLETYRRVMEAPATINTPQVMAALQQGKAAFEFEVELKKSDQWMGTQNGQDTMYSAISELGSRMGFV